MFSANSVEVLETALERCLVRIPALLDQVPRIMEALDEARSRLAGGSHKVGAGYTGDRLPSADRMEVSEFSMGARQC